MTPTHPAAADLDDQPLPVLREAVRHVLPSERMLGYVVCALLFVVAVGGTMGFMWLVWGTW